MHSGNKNSHLLIGDIERAFASCGPPGDEDLVIDKNSFEGELVFREYQDLVKSEIRCDDNRLCSWVDGFRWLSSEAFLYFLPRFMVLTFDKAAPFDVILNLVLQFGFDPNSRGDEFPMRFVDLSDEQFSVICRFLRFHEKSLVAAGYDDEIKSAISNFCVVN